MNAMIAAALVLDVLTGNPLLHGPGLDQALSDYRAVVSGGLQLSDLPSRRRKNVLELQRLLNSKNGLRASETQQECKERLASESPSRLEEALLDLKCSQRPDRRRSSQ